MKNEFETRSQQNRSNLSSVSPLFLGPQPRYGTEMLLGWAQACRESNIIRLLRRDSGISIRISILPAIALCLLVSGCRTQPRFQLREVMSPHEGGIHRHYDSTGDGQPDFFTFADSSGRISRIGYDNDVDAAPDIIVNLDEIPAAHRVAVPLGDGGLHVGHIWQRPVQGCAGTIFRPQNKLYGRRSTGLHKW
jgi:hypothetical protein